MSIFGEMMDIVKDAKSINKAIYNNATKNSTRGSIARQAKAGILQFPAHISDSIPIDKGIMVKKALERNFVSFISVISTLETVTDANNIKEYIKRIHANDYGIADEVGAELRTHANALFESNVTFGVSSALRHDVDVLLESEMVLKGYGGAVPTMNEHGDMCSDKDCVRYNELTDKQRTYANIAINAFKHDNPESSVHKHRDLDSVCCKLKDGSYEQMCFLQGCTEDDFQIVSTKVDPSKIQCINENKGFNSKFFDKETKILSEAYTSPYNMTSLSESCPGIKSHIVTGDNELNDKYSTWKMNDVLNEADETEVVPTTHTKQILTDMDAKKANELQPTVMQLKTNFKTDSGIHEVSFFIGVQTVLHPMRSSSIIENLPMGLNKRNLFLRFVKMTTGEISFLKDFVFALDRTKNEVKNNKKGNKWWGALERRRKFAQVSAMLTGKNVSPIASMIISSDEVEIMKAESGVDLNIPAHAAKIMAQYYLLTMVIVDESTETVKIMIDGNNDYTAHSYSSLEKENANASRQVNNVMKLMNNM